MKFINFKKMIEKNISDYKQNKNNKNYYKYLGTLNALFDLEALYNSNFENGSYEDFKKMIRNYILDMTKEFDKELNILDCQIFKKTNYDCNNQYLTEMEFAENRFNVSTYCINYITILEDFITISAQNYKYLFSFINKIRGKLYYDIYREELLSKNDDNFFFGDLTDDEFVIEILDKIKENHNKYNENLHNTVSRLSRGGENIDEFIKKQIEAAAMYFLYLNAVNDSIKSKDEKEELSEEKLKVKFIDSFSNPMKDGSLLHEYFSDDDYETYSKIFKRTYMLDKKSRRKLERKLPKDEK